MAEMPGIYAPIECDHCFTSLNNDGDGMTCEPCGLYWPDPNPYADVTPVFLDEDAEPCGDDGGRNEREHSGCRFWDGPCNLPEGHESKHHHPIEFERLPALEPDVEGSNR